MYADFSQVAHIQPKQATNVVVTRLKRFKQQEQDISDYFKDRSIIESVYAQQLAKLAKKFTQVQDAVLGEVGGAFSMVTSNANDTSKQHMLLSEKLAADSELPMQSEIKQFEVPLTKMAKEWHDRNQKLSQATSDVKQAKYREQLDKHTQLWLSQSSAIFEQVEAVDRKSLETLKIVLQKNIEFQISNLQLQLMNLESIKLQIDKIEVDKELQAFMQNNTKHFQKVDMNMFASPVSNAESVTAPSIEAVKEEEQVDADGYKIPQMDRNQWKQQVKKDDSDSDTETPQKFTIDIKQEAVSSNQEDLEKAAALFKMSEVGTIARKGRRQEPTQIRDPFGSLNELPQAVTMQQSGYSFKCLEVVTGSVDTQEITGTLFMVAGQYSDSMPAKYRIAISLDVVEVYDNVAKADGGIIVELTKFTRSDIERPLAKYSVKKVLRLPLQVSSKIRTQQQSQLLVLLEPKNPNIKDLSVLVNVDEATTQVTTKPQAVYNKERQKILWRLGDVSTQIKLLAQWDTTSSVQPIMVRFIINGINMSGIEVNDPDNKPLQVQYSQGVALSVATTQI